MSRFTPLALDVIAIALGNVALATTFEKAVNPNYSYLQGVQQTIDGGYVVGGVVSVPPMWLFWENSIRAATSSGRSSMNTQETALRCTL